MQYEETRKSQPEIAQNTSMSEQTRSDEQERAPLSQRTVWILSVACALSIANLYYNQPLLADMAHSFSVTQSTVGFIATLCQLGYAAGLLLIVPLGDAVSRRLLITLTLLAVAASMLLTALAPSIPLLALATFAVGITTVAPQIIVPFAASLSRLQERGRVVGTVMSGLLIGILLARTISGAVGEYWGWRTMYWIAAGAMVLLALVLRLILPRDQPHTELSYPLLLRSLWTLLRTEPVVREVGLFGGLAFGSFSAFWVTLVFFLGQPPYHFGSQVAGLFGLVGVAGAVAASFVGRLADRINPRIMTGCMLLTALLAFLFFWLVGQMLWGLIVGVILLDLGTQGAHISNQARIYRLRGEAHSRLNTLYMVSYFIGGSLGSMLGSYAWGVARWNGVCFVGVLLLVLSLAVYALHSRPVPRPS